MKHGEYIRIAEDKTSAVVFIHGINGTPRHFDRIIPLVPESISVYNLLLDGHGGNALDFARTSMKKWKRQVADRLADICGLHKNVAVVAHSMGTLFATEALLLYPDRIRSAVFFAPPLKILPKPIVAVNSARIAFDLVNPDNKVLTAGKNAYGIATDRRFWRYVGWAPRYVELLSHSKRIRKLTGNVTVPTTVLLSKKDELVSVKTAEYFRENESTRILFLSNSTHFYYSDVDFDIIKNEMSAVINKLI